MPTHQSRPLLRRSGRVVAAVTTVGAGLLLFAGPASAHIEIQEGDQAADSYATLTFGVPHGCEESPTTKIRIQLPENVPTVTPYVNPNWDITFVKEQLDTPIDLGEGESLTERITEVDFTARTPLPIGFADLLKLSVHIPKDAAGTTLRFPTIQECEVGTTEWTQIPEAGQDAEELPHPAPAVNVVAASAEGDHHGDDAAEASTTTSSDDDSDDGGSDRGLAIGGLVAGIVGIVVGGAAFARSKGSAGSGAAE
jgi:uncharacterized protein YcnI